MDDKFFIGITFAGVFLSAIIFEGYKVDRHGLNTIIKIVIVLLCIATFISSNELTRLRKGSKITDDEAEFAFKFKEMDPALTKTLFLSPGKAWMAHLSNKIPYDVKAGHFVPYEDIQAIRDAGFQEMNLKRSMWEKIYEEECIPCIYELNVTYVVINKKYSNITLPEEPVLIYKNFDVYKLIDCR